MKNIFLSIIIFLILGMGQISFAQGVAINTDNSDPHPSAMLDVKSSDKGFLPPRVNLAGDVNFPAAGLIVYETSSNRLMYFNGSEWVALTLLSGEESCGSCQCMVDTITIPISSAQFLNLDDMPVELLPASGTGNYNKLLGVDIKYNFVTTPYEAGGTFYVYNSLDGTPPVSLGSNCTFFSNQNFLTNNFPSVRTFHPSEGEVTENSSVWLISDGPITLGDGTGKVRLFFIVSSW